MTPEEIAQLRQDLADARVQVTRLTKEKDDREADNARAREKVRALEAEKADLAGKLPAKDAIVLAGDDAKAWAAYQELGKPDLVKVKLEDYDRATAEASTLKRSQLVDKAARDPKDETAYRYKPSVLERLLADTSLKANDKGEYLVKVGDAEKALEKWLEEDQADFLPAVQVTPNGTPAIKQPGARTNQPQLTPEQLAERKRATGEYDL